MGIWTKNKGANNVFHVTFKACHTLYVSHLLSVYQEVENRIAAFRDMLTKKLLTLPSSLEEQKRLIR